MAFVIACTLLLLLLLAAFACVGTAAVQAQRARQLLGHARGPEETPPCP